MLISDSRRFVRVLCYMARYPTGLLCRIGLCVASINGRVIGIDTPSISIYINDVINTYRLKITGCESRPCARHITPSLFSFLHNEYSYTHNMLNELKLSNCYMARMLFVGITRCELLPPMLYLTSDHITIMGLQKIDSTIAIL